MSIDVHVQMEGGENEAESVRPVSATARQVHIHDAHHPHGMDAFCEEQRHVSSVTVFSREKLHSTHSPPFCSVLSCPRRRRLLDRRAPCRVSDIDIIIIMVLEEREAVSLIDAGCQADVAVTSSA